MYNTWINEREYRDKKLGDSDSKEVINIMDYIKDAHKMAIVKYNITSEEFYNLTIAEFGILSEKYITNLKHKKTMMAEQAYYNASMIMQDKAYDNYKKIVDDINDKSIDIEVSKRNDRKWKAKLIATAKMNGLNVPKEW
jgi:hypothetical protein